MPTANQTFMVQAYSKKELCDLYGVSAKTFKSWLQKINDLGAYKGRRYTPAQVSIITQHLGTP